MAGELGSSGSQSDPLAATNDRTAKTVAELKLARRKLEASSLSASMLAPAIRAFRRTEQRLGRPLRVAICGEFNSGKSSLANLLARVESLPTSVLSNTRIPTLLYYAREPQIRAVHRDGTQAALHPEATTLSPTISRLEVGLPSRRLEAIQLLDLPGVADPRLRAPAASPSVHDFDAVLWCTVSTQAWKESERAAWARLPTRLRLRGLLVVTHRDLLRSADDADRLSRRLHGEVGSAFREIVLLSTLDALALLRAGPERPADAGWQATGAAALESALDALVRSMRDQRVKSALRMIARLADRSLSSLERLQA